jgi:hypothetical protein
VHAGAHVRVRLRPRRVDEAAQYAISSATRGTFSFVDGHASVQDAMARCVAGPRSVTAQGVWIEVDLRCQYEPEIGVAGVKFGGYKSKVDSDEEAWVSVGELYADEERRFLFLFDVERDDDPHEYSCTRLFMARCVPEASAQAVQPPVPGGLTTCDVEMAEQAVQPPVQAVQPPVAEEAPIDASSTPMQCDELTSAVVPEDDEQLVDYASSPEHLNMDINVIHMSMDGSVILEEEMAHLDFGPKEAIFQKPKDGANHLKALYVKGFINGTPISRMLVDGGGAIVNLMPYSLFKKIGGKDDELIKTNMTVSGVGGGEPIGAKGVTSMELTVGSKTIATAFFVAETQGNFSLILLYINS